MYLMTCTRPDLSYPLSLLARYVAPSRRRKVHWDVAKRVLCYLCITSGMGLVLGGQGSVVLTGHSDASWAYDQTTHRSTHGYSFSLDTGSFSWRSTRSSSVLSSSCEAEIYAGAMAPQELRWLTYLLTDLGEQPCSPPVLYVKNKAMIALFQDQRLEHRTNHIAFCYFLTRELQQGGQLCLAYVATQANTAGRTGRTGQQGSKGSRTAGRAGRAGLQCARGAQGSRAAWRAGRTGLQGAQGAQGSRTAGRTGRAGLQGARGAQGSRTAERAGRTGLQGSRARGARRAAGRVGRTGQQGSRARGANKVARQQGARGAQGCRAHRAAEQQGARDAQGYRAHRAHRAAGQQGARGAQGCRSPSPH
ncbi:unnamed protein product [Closterium sp. NIES-53]